MVFAQPFDVITGTINKKIGKTSLDAKPWVEAKVNDEDQTFSTQGFLMRYYDE